jgi:Flp pilus assembly protein TadB
MIIAAITITGFILIIMFMCALVMTMGVLFIIRQHRNKRCNDKFKKRYGIDQYDF